MVFKYAKKILGESKHGVPIGNTDVLHRGHSYPTDFNPIGEAKWKKIKPFTKVK